MSLIIVIQNTTGGPVSDYRYQVRVNERVIEEGTLIGHYRKDPWRALVRKLVETEPPSPPPDGPQE